MYKQLVILLAAASLTACSEKEEVAQKQTTPVAKAESTLQTYKSQAKSLLADIRTQNAAQDLETSSATLVATSRKLLSEFTVKYPQCKTYLGALDAAADIIPTLPLEEIETGYHADGKLPKFDDPVCYHAKDLLVHPATVQAIAKLGFKSDTAYQDAELEIVEVIAHFDQVERALN